MVTASTSGVAGTERNFVKRAFSGRQVHLYRYTGKVSWLRGSREPYIIITEILFFTPTPLNLLSLPHFLLLFTFYRYFFTPQLYSITVWSELFTLYREIISPAGSSLVNKGVHFFCIF